MTLDDQYTYEGAIRGCFNEATEEFLRHLSIRPYDNSPPLQGSGFNHTSLRVYNRLYDKIPHLIVIKECWGHSDDEVGGGTAYITSAEVKVRPLTEEDKQLISNLCKDFFD